VVGTGFVTHRSTGGCSRTGDDVTVTAFLGQAPPYLGHVPLDLAQAEDQVGKLIRDSLGQVRNGEKDDEDEECHAVVSACSRRFSGQVPSVGTKLYAGRTLVQ
jgi:hypothetical protein